MAKFFRGQYALYNAETHADGIYFATDKGIIIMNGVEYVGDLAEVRSAVETLKTAVSVSDVAYATDTQTFTVTYSDGSTKEIVVETASGEYASAIEDKTLAMPSAVGGIAKGTKLSDLEGKSYDAIFDDLLFPTVYPTYTAPSASIKLANYTATQEVGAVAPTSANFTTSFNAGAITLNGVKQNNRAGAQDTANSFIYVNGDTSNTTLPTTVAEGGTTYQYYAAYAEGAQPKDNKGNDYQSPLAAGSVNSSAVTVNGTYPWYASTSAATAENPVVKQSLIAWNATAGSMSTGSFALQPSGTIPQVFKFPRQIKSLQMLNTVSNQYETIGWSDSFTETTETISINGNDRTYYVYTYNGAARGSVTLKATF